MEPNINADLLHKFQTVAQGPDGDLLINLLDILYDRITARIMTINISLTMI